MERIDLVVSLSKRLYRDLQALGRQEQGEPSQYLVRILRRELRSRKDAGWTAAKGWPETDHWLPPPKPRRVALTLVPPVTPPELPAHHCL
jgi:hypothetical protein